MKKLNVDEYKQIVLEVLVKLDAICRENGLRYALAYGTLLGAIRHNGFIPWDDDADIVMFREDYDRLREIIGAGGYGLRFIDTVTDKNTIFPFGKVCDARTHLKEKNFRTFEGYGAFVDVFPLDALPDDAAERKRCCRKYRRWMIMATHSSRTGYEKTDSRWLNLKRAAALRLGRLVDPRRTAAHMNQAFLAYNAAHQTSMVGIPWAWGGFAFEKKIFESLTEHEFEGHMLSIPTEYDYVLRWRYGDYMQLPPESERVNLHQIECYIDE